MPVPALNLVTPELVTVILLALVIGPPDINNPVPEATNPTLVTVPTDAAFDIVTTRPYWSTCIVG